IWARWNFGIRKGRLFTEPKCFADKFPTEVSCLSCPEIPAVDAEVHFMRRKAPLTFEQAKIKADSYLRHQEELPRLLEKATRKSKRCYESILAPWESLQILLRLLRAQFTGKFCAPADSILMAIAAV